MAKVSWRPAALLAPVPPALVSCGSMEHPNLITVAWCGIVNSNPAMTYISVRPERYSHALIKDNGEFVINLTTGPMVRAVDFCGVKSGRELDKWKATGLRPEAAQLVSAPMVEQSPVSLECRVKEVKSLGSHDMFLAEIVAVNVREELIDEKGKLHLEQCGLAAYSHGEYFVLGKKVGQFGFSVKKRPKYKGRPRKKN